MVTVQIQKSNQPKKIGHMEFGLLSPKEIRGLSATKVITADTYDDDGFPIEMGLMDPRLGVIEPGLRCKTCGQKVGDCPGHFGHIDLAMPVIHVGFVRVVRDILRSSCRGCGKLLFSERIRQDFDRLLKTYTQEEKDTSLLAKRVAKEASNVTVCPHCGREHGNIDVDKPTTFRENGHKMTPSEVREWLEKVPNEDLPLLGINPNVCRPEWMVLTVLPVPPVTMRPSITLESGERSEDDLTHKLVDVIRINQRLQENRDAGAPQLIVEDLWELLQYHITTYFDNQTAGIPPARHRSGRPLKTISQRLKGKEGRFRSNLSGKRVNFSARTVISPDPNLSINEVGVPVDCARELTVPVRVTAANFSYAMELILRGPEPKDGAEGKYLPGVNYVIRPDGRRVKVTDKNADEVAKRLEVGSIVERQLDDGDVVLFNRQPTLHRMSMMAHTVRVMPGKTFRFNLPCCPPYNADFDGDEMNLHVIQGEEARAEAEILMKVQENIRSPRFGGPIIGAIHDHISGNFLLTWKNPKLELEDATQVLARVGFKGQLPEIHEEKDDRGEVRKYVYGRDLFSTLLPPGINISFKANAWRPDEPKEENMANDFWVEIVDSKLVRGGIDKSAIASEKGKLLDLIARKYGNAAAREFLDKVTKVGNGYLTLRGFTTSIEDEDLPEDAQREIQERIRQTKARVEALVRQHNKGELQPLPGRTAEETLEMEIMRETGQARDFAGDAASRHLGMDNSAVLMARCGARGSMLNLSQMAGLVGQQAVRGKRIHRGYQKRTLPHFKWGDLGAEAKGFVAASYKSGLTPTEYFFHSMGGREGLVDTAVRTSRSGYMQRRLINALEDLKVAQDGTVRNTAGTIIQFLYGEDGVDPSRSTSGDAVDYEAIFQAVERGATKGTAKKAKGGA
ncbi:MAG TPA: DNA-directed RNA polymerase subunit A' [Candidatus Thermoplasmatota archaeon]|nr:DNA-directed RNA polymerase subunit A' [Candidatus Thermoplasmatota archaeon]